MWQSSLWVNICCSRKKKCCRPPLEVTVNLLSGTRNFNINAVQNYVQLQQQQQLLQQAGYKRDFSDRRLGLQRAGDYFIVRLLWRPRTSAIAMLLLRQLTVRGVMDFRGRVVMAITASIDHPRAGDATRHDARTDHELNAADSAFDRPVIRVDSIMTWSVSRGRAAVACSCDSDSVAASCSGSSRRRHRRVRAEDRVKDNNLRSSNETKDRAASERVSQDRESRDVSARD